MSYKETKALEALNDAQESMMKTLELLSTLVEEQEKRIDQLEEWSITSKARRHIVVSGVLYSLLRTCVACPEQYDVTQDGVQAGYLRLRHGHFTTSSPDYGDTVVYECEPEGDGSFEDHERGRYLLAAIEAIHRHRQ